MFCNSMTAISDVAPSPLGTDKQFLIPALAGYEKYFGEDDDNILQFQPYGPLFIFVKKAVKQWADPVFAGSKNLVRPSVKEKAAFPAFSSNARIVQAKPVLRSPEAPRIISPALNLGDIPKIISAAAVSPAVIPPPGPSALVLPLAGSLSVPSQDLFLAAAPNDSYYGLQWGLAAVNIEPAWNFTKGSGVAIAIIDTGLDFTHPDLLSNIWFNTGEIAGNGLDDDVNGLVDDFRGWDFYFNDNNPTDDHGHGTHVAGISAAVQNNLAGISGIAPESKVMALKVLNSAGGGLVSTVLTAINNAIRYAADEGARVINMSLGIPLTFFTTATLNAFRDAIDYAYSKGTYTIVSAGNEGSQMQNYPALFDHVFAIGSMFSSTVLSYFSSTGPQLDFTAPGSNILSLKAAGTNSAPSYDAAGKYMYLSGTSMAAPLVAGAVALLLSEFPNLSFEDVYRRLKFSASDRGAAGFDNFYGYGMINPFKALSEDYYEDGQLKTLWLTAPDASGVVQYDYAPDGVTVRKLFSSGVIETFFPGGQLESRFDPATGIRQEYYLSGVLRKEISALGNSEEYLDENFYGTDAQGHGHGRVSRRLYTNGTEYQYLEYWPGTDTRKKIQKLQSGALVKTTEYDASGNAAKETLPDGTNYFYNTSGTYKGYRSKEVTGTGKIFLFEYTGSGASVSALKKEVVPTVKNSTVLQGTTTLLRSTNPVSKFNFLFYNDGTPSQNVIATATGTVKSLTVTLTPGTGSTFTFAGVTAALPLTLLSNVRYNVEIRWQSNGIGIFVWDALLAKPAAPVKLITDKAWDPKFKVASSNADINLVTGYSGAYTRTSGFSESSNAYQTGGSIEKLRFKFNSASSANTLLLTAEQAATGGIARTITFKYLSGIWTVTRADKNLATNVTTNTVSTVAQTLTSGVSYFAEVRIEAGKANLYVYQESAARPAAAKASAAAFSADTKMSASSANAVTYGELYQNTSSPAASSLLAESVPLVFTASNNILSAAEESSDAQSPEIPGELLSRMAMEESLIEERKSSSPESPKDKTLKTFSGV